MNQGCRKGRFVTGLGLFTLVLRFSLAAHAAESLDWRKDKDSVDADISSWSLLKTLEIISEATGWQVYVEPGTQKKVSTKFKDRPRDRALDLLLGNLGRALLPGTNGGPPRFLVFRNAQRDATRLIRARGKAKPIPNELIVRMKKGKSVDDLAKTFGAKVLGKSKGMNSGRLQFKDEDAAEKARESLLDNEDVSSVDPNFPVAAQPVPEGSAASGGPNLKLAPLKDGEAVVVALIDTAVQRQGAGLDDFLLPGVSVARDAADATSEQPTHGTGMVDALADGASAVTECVGGTRVRILPVDVYGSEATTSTYEVAEGIYQAMQKGASVINMSLGSEGDTPYLHDVIRQGSQAGRIFVGSAGNTPVTTPTFPAAYPEVIAVTAGEAPGRVASYANRGAFVDMMAPGNATLNFNGQTWRISGTSPAAAFISGAIAGAADCGGRPLSQAVSSIRAAFPPPAAP